MASINISGGDLEHLSIEEIIRKASQFEADGVELKWGKNVSSLEGVNTLKGVLDASHKKVEVLNSFLFRSVDELDRPSGSTATFDKCLAAAQVLGANFILVYCACQPADTLEASESERQLHRYLDALEPCASACARAGIALVVENHPNTRLRSLDATRELLREAESLGLRLAFDPANFYNSRVEPYPLAYHSLKKYISVLHAKDSAQYDPTVYGPDVEVLTRVIDAVCVPLGTGATNWEGLCEELKKDGFDGPIVVEPHTALKDLDNAFTVNIRYLRSKGFGR